MPNDHPWACRAIIVLISGSLRARSASSAAILAAAELAPDHVTPTIYAGLSELPHFNPDHDCDPLPEPVARLRMLLGKAHAVMLSTPEYAGSLPGSFKNMIDWTVGGASLYQRPIGWINPSAHGGAQETYKDLRTVLERAGAVIVEEACVAVPVPPTALTADGHIAAPDIRATIADAMAALVRAASAHDENAPPSS
ncbi:NADPH-dependent FMN reductase [Bradyrhizobium sp. HKCCYLS20291]|uniref:NADPH-dependent FMN reductase n=1 Tax=Bradyrhizobium sp. HKCCYLS20291 TaxID=3420766 RepID=UPI003EBFF176